VSPGWPALGVEICPNVGYSSTGGQLQASMFADGAGGAFVPVYRKTAVTGWGGTIHVQRLGSQPPMLGAAPVAATSPSIATIQNVNVTFDAVTTAGEMFMDLTTGPVPPAGQRTVPDGMVYELTTTAAYSGDIQVCIDYDPAQVVNESTLRLLHFEGASGPPQWVDVTANVDVQANRICGQTTSLSPFAVVEDVPTDAVTPSIALRLHQNLPNPFNPSTVIAFEMPSRGHASLRIYNVQGRLVQTVVDGIANAGLHRVLWTGEDQHGDPVASGVYFYGLETPGGILSRRMVLLR
jgi:hypothetical protein